MRQGILCSFICFFLFCAPVNGKNTAVIQMTVDNPSFKFESQSRNNFVDAIDQFFTNKDIVKSPPGRAQRLFCLQDRAILYPIIEPPPCEADLITIDVIILHIYMLEDNRAEVSSLGLIRGHAKQVEDYTHLLPNLEHVFEAHNDWALLNMIELERVDAVIMEEVSADRLGLIKKYPSLLLGKYRVFAAFRGLDDHPLFKCFDSNLLMFKPC